MSASHVQVAPDSTGAKIDAVDMVSTEAGTPNVKRQTVTLGDPTTYGNIAGITSAGELKTATADGANAALGATTDTSSTSTVVGILKGILARLTGTLTTNATIQGTPNVSVANLPATQPVSGTVAVSNLPATQPVSGTVGVNNFPATQTVAGTVTANDGGSPISGQSLPTGSGVTGWLSRIYATLAGTLATSRTWTLSNGTDSVNVGNFPATQPVSGTVAVSNLPATQPVSGTVSVGNFPATQTVSGSVSVSNFPATQPVSGTVTANAGSGTMATSVADGSNVTIGTTTDTATATTVIGRLQKLISLIPSALGQTTKAASLSVAIASDQATAAAPLRTDPTGTTTQPVSGTVAVSNLPGTQPVSGTVTANAGTGTMATSVADGANVAMGTTTDAASASTTIGLLKNIKAALAGTLATNATIQGTPTVVANVGTGTQPVSGTVGVSGTVATSVADGGNVTIGTTTDASSASTLVGLLKAIKASVAGTLTTNATVSNFPATQTVAGTVTANAGTGTMNTAQQAQSSLSVALCSTVTSTTPSTGQSIAGYDGAATLEIVAVGTVAAQAVSLQIEGSLDNTNWYIIGIAQIDATANLTRSAANFTLTPGSGTIRHLYTLLDTVKFLRVNPTANSLGTGLTVNLFTQPV